MANTGQEHWTIGLERQLMDTERTFAVVTTADLASMARQGQPRPVPPATLQRWLTAATQSGKLREVTKGVYLVPMARPQASPAAAAQWIRRGAIPSLSWVLEQAWILNNMSDTITCVIPHWAGTPNPQVGLRQTKAGPFRFFAMPAQLVDPERLGSRTEDALDDRFDYPRATPEKALLDWIYLGSSSRSRLQRPPLDLDLKALNRPRLNRLAKCMKIEAKLQAWLELWQAYQDDPDVQSNASVRLGF